MAKSPTAWSFNPLASTANLINYDVSTEPYDNSTQPYDGVTNQSYASWKNPTAYTPLSELYQLYYGGPTSVPLFAAPITWVFNPGINNQNATYVPSEGATANLYPYDQSTRPYDGTLNGTYATYSSSSVTYSDSDVTFAGDSLTPNASDYDGTNNGLSFNSWKQPTDWTPITGGSF